MSLTYGKININFNCRTQDSLHYLHVVLKDILCVRIRDRDCTELVCLGPEGWLLDQWHRILLVDTLYVDIED
jgi:hypothetical protein